MPLVDTSICSEKTAAPGEKSFVCWNIARARLWLLCNMHFVQSTQRTRLQTRPFVHGINNLLNHCSSEEYRCTHVDACVVRTWISYRCAVSPVVHTSNISNCKKKTFSVFLRLWTIPFKYVLWFSCYKCLQSWRTLWNALCLSIKSGFLKCDGDIFGKQVPKFQRHMLPASSGLMTTRKCR
jgi:hypothetical protein